ncbi:MAG TPA: hypothetical protein VHU88_14390 [Sporichthyaceae bacterium]|nr:hypothetical protein [Sporichthyaceae bacterium]
MTRNPAWAAGAVLVVGVAAGGCLGAAAPGAQCASPLSVEVPGEVLWGSIGLAVACAVLLPLLLARLLPDVLAGLRGVALVTVCVVSAAMGVAGSMWDLDLACITGAPLFLADWFYPLVTAGALAS